MAKHSEARIVGQVTTAAVGLIVAACALSACVGTTARPHPEPGQVVVAAAPAKIHG